MQVRDVLLAHAGQRDRRRDLRRAATASGAVARATRSNRRIGRMGRCRRSRRRSSRSSRARRRRSSGSCRPGSPRSRCSAGRRWCRPGRCRSGARGAGWCRARRPSRRARRRRGSRTLGSTCGSKIGGSLPPSGVYEPRRRRRGSRTAAARGSACAAGAESARGSCTSTPCQLTGSSRLPAAVDGEAQIGGRRVARSRRCRGGVRGEAIGLVVVRRRQRGEVREGAERHRRAAGAVVGVEAVDARAQARLVAHGKSRGRRVADRPAIRPRSPPDRRASHPRCPGRMPAPAQSLACVQRLPSFGAAVARRAGIGERKLRKRSPLCSTIATPASAPATHVARPPPSCAAHVDELRIDARCNRRRPSGRPRSSAPSAAGRSR